jgi:hypothetical protein
MGPSYEKQKDISVCLVKTEIVTCWKNPYLIGGSLGAVLLVFAMINDSILLHEDADWNLLWYVSCWRYSAGKAMIPSGRVSYGNYVRRD